MLGLGQLFLVLAMARICAGQQHTDAQKFPCSQNCCIIKAEDYESVGVFEFKNMVRSCTADLREVKAHLQSQEGFLEFGVANDAILRWKRNSSLLWQQDVAYVIDRLQ
ncbi:hypothetical protein K493DRAFT_315631 [Basidiobolus meristosporus CBS 931.73]|uniref:Secreted protein n=1 Tax=Basidiobolus meristosporus CBS 931.73 TaxID=1314790 RepID=A0A1Y1Y8G8_9FUNG|nr:hypothetical protein K493DRAFT_315631 [Basidiobolus meristosporus CBS 931.73]|eukprot:ORX94165.1 hypothetical protein K493DRAFT_315631 [Basidiobolus meristosporus CBS 931.73]